MDLGPVGRAGSVGNVFIEPRANIAKNRCNTVRNDPVMLHSPGAALSDYFFKRVDCGIALQVCCNDPVNIGDAPGRKSGPPLSPPGAGMLSSPEKYR